MTPATVCRFISVPVLGLALSLTEPTRALALEPVVLDDSREKYPLGLHLEYLEDPTGKLTFEDIRSEAYKDRFVQSKSATPNFGLTSAAVWVRFKVLAETAAPQEWILDTLYGVIPDELDFYDEVRPGEYQVTRTGALRDYETRQIPHRNFIFRIAPRPGGEHTYYLRYACESVVFTPLTLWTEESFARVDQNRLLLDGLYFGTLLIMFLYNLFLFLTLRDKTYFYYILHVLSLGLFLLFYNGLASQFLGVKSAWWNARGLFLISSVWAASIAQFARLFLLTKKHAPRIDRLLIAFIFWGVLLSPALFLVDFRWCMTVGGVMDMLLPISFLVAAVACIRRGYRPARYYLLAWSAFLLGIVMAGLYALGFLDFILFPDFPAVHFQAASAVEVALLSLALGDRLNELAREKHRAETVASASQRLARYFPKRLVARILSSDEPVSLSSARRQSTVFFSDLTGFTDFSDRTEPERVSRMLNEYFTEMVALMNQYGCTLDKFMGDGIMAFFGAPDDMDEKEQAKRAVSMAVAMQKKLGELGRKWLDEGLDHSIRMRCGIHQEYVTVGNFGSADLMSYTAIGGGVNLASRLETSCAPGKILVSFPVYALTKADFPYEELQERSFKGFARPHHVCELDPEKSLSRA